VGWTVLPELFSACNYSITTTVQYKFFTQALGKCAYRAEETDVPAAAKTGDISDSAKERKDWTTTGSKLSATGLGEPAYRFLVRQAFCDRDAKKPWHQKHR